jgi:hypothetical protein
MLSECCYAAGHLCQVSIMLSSVFQKYKNNQNLAKSLDRALVSWNISMKTAKFCQTKIPFSDW